MSQQIELSNFNWQTLIEYIESRLAGILDILNEDTFNKLDSELKESLHKQLNRLQRQLDLVVEIQNQNYLEFVIPIMSVDIIRLGCRKSDDNQVRTPEFAWIFPFEEGKYEVALIESKENKEVEPLLYFKGNLNETIEALKELACEKCLGEN